MIIKPTESVVEYTIKLTPQESIDMYNDLSNVFSRLGTDMASYRATVPLKILYKLYDELYKVGVDL